MEIFGPFLISSIAGLSTLIGGLFIFININKYSINKFITFCLSLSISVMILVSIVDLIPSSLNNLIGYYGLGKGFFIGLVSFIIGHFIINLCDKIEIKNNNSLFKIGFLSMISLMIHNFPEGIATYISSSYDINLGIKVGISILLHNIPEGICIAIPIYYATRSRGKAILYTLISGLSEPFGALMAWLFLSRMISDTFISLILINVAGIMITLAINNLYVKIKEYNYPKYFYLGIMSGVLLIMVNLLII